MDVLVGFESDVAKGMSENEQFHRARYVSDISMLKFHPNKTCNFASYKNNDADANGNNQ